MCVYVHTHTYEASRFSDSQTDSDDEEEDDDDNNSEVCEATYAQRCIYVIIAWH
jgi:hypothetical protein